MGEDDRIEREGVFVYLFILFDLVSDYLMFIKCF